MSLKSKDDDLKLFHAHEENGVKVENFLKVAMGGNVDAGKSTITGVLISGKYDDGRGSARKGVMRLKHEQESGRTSAISYNNLIYKEEDKKKVITLVDLAGHERYLKTTVFGLTGSGIHYGIVMVGANMGVSKMTKEHLAILLFLKIPIIVVVSKIDICPPGVYARTIEKLRKLLTIKQLCKRPLVITKDDLPTAEEEMDKFLEDLFSDNQIIPIISVSNKTGQNLSLVHKYIKNLVPRIIWPTPIDSSILYVDSEFMVDGVGLIVSGTLRGTTVKTKDNLWIGPVKKNYSLGMGKKKFKPQDLFYPIQIRSIHNNMRDEVEEIKGEQFGCVACYAIRFTDKSKKLNRKQIKKGMVVLSDPAKMNNVVWEFKASVTILHHSTTITENYQPVIHCGTIRQTARFIFTEESSKRVLRTKDKDIIVHFKFNYHPELMEVGSTFFFKDGATKGYGKVLDLIDWHKVEEEKIE